METPIVEKTPNKSYQFQKGNKMSPGRRKGSINMSTMLKELLHKLNIGETLTPAEKISLSLIRQAEVGDLKAIEMVLDRTDGKPVQQNQNLNIDIPVYLQDKQKETLLKLLNE